jgi:hypothetical protein
LPDSDCGELLPRLGGEMANAVYERHLYWTAADSEMWVKVLQLSHQPYTPSAAASGDLSGFMEAKMADDDINAMPPIEDYFYYKLVDPTGITWYVRTKSTYIDTAPGFNFGFFGYDTCDLMSLDQCINSKAWYRTPAGGDGFTTSVQKPCSFRGVDLDGTVSCTDQDYSMGGVRCFSGPPMSVDPENCSPTDPMVSEREFATNIALYKLDVSKVPADDQELDGELIPFDTPVYLKGILYGKCMHMKDDSYPMMSGQEAAMYAGCDEAVDPYRMQYVASKTDGGFFLKNLASGLCLRADGGRATDHTKLVLGSCVDARSNPEYEFTAKAVSNAAYEGSFMLQSTQTGACVHPDGGLGTFDNTGLVFFHQCEATDDVQRILFDAELASREDVGTNTAVKCSMTAKDVVLSTFLNGVPLTVTGDIDDPNVVKEFSMTPRSGAVLAISAFDKTVPGGTPMTAGFVMKCDNGFTTTVGDSTWKVTGRPVDMQEWMNVETTEIGWGSPVESDSYVFNNMVTIGDGPVVWTEATAETPMKTAYFRAYPFGKGTGYTYKKGGDIPDTPDGVPAGFILHEKACVNGANIVKFSDKSVAECAALCTGHGPECLGFEYGVPHGGAGTAYQPRDCQLNSKATYAGCNGVSYNLDFYERQDDLPAPIIDVPSPTAAPTWSSESPMASVDLSPLPAEFTHERAESFCCVSQGEATYHKNLFRCRYAVGDGTYTYRAAPQNAWIRMSDGVYPNWYDAAQNIWVPSTRQSNYATTPSVCPTV